MELRTIAKVAAQYEGKLVGDEYRLQWGRNGFLLEELPAKGKKKLLKAFFSFPPYRGGANFMIPENLLRDAKVDRNDSAEEVTKKISKAWGIGVENAKEGKYGDSDKSYVEVTKSYISDITWEKSQVHFLQIEPEGVEPFSVEAKDFSVQVSWTSFKAYSPRSDLQQPDPHYTYYSESAAAGARKLYKILKGDPKALKSVSWMDFSGWLTKQGISYDTHFSSW